MDALLARLDIRGKLTLVVHDIGGIMAVPWAARHVDRLDAMIYANTVAYPGFKWFDLAYRWGNDSPAGRRRAKLSMNALGWLGGWLFKTVFARQHPKLSKTEL